MFEQCKIVIFNNIIFIKNIRNFPEKCNGNFPKFTNDIGLKVGLYSGHPIVYYWYLHYLGQHILLLDF